MTEIYINRYALTLSYVSIYYAKMCYICTQKLYLVRVSIADKQQKNVAQLQDH